MRFDDHFLDEIRARLSVSQVVGRRVALKKAGREYRGLSPFKVEKTPSFFVNDQKGSWFDFSSGQNGDIFKFVMLTEGLSFPEAVERLAEEAGVPLPKRSEATREREQEVRDERERLYALLEASAAFFRQQLAANVGAEARGYIERRCLKREAVERFRLGFGPPGRSALKDHLSGLGFTVAEMILSGMLIGGDDIAVPYDRFRNRVMFPILDLKGRVIAFGGRALDPAQPAKYHNSPETPLFHKGHNLFNAANARPAAHASGRIIVVEGYMDVIALAEAGFPEAVAPLGTALTEEQVKLLWRFVPEPMLCFDGDSAGRKAAFRAVDTVLPHLKPGYSVSFAFLPDGLDPDDLIRQRGAEAMAAVLAAARPLSDVVFEREVSGGDTSTPERRARLEQRLRELTRQIGDPAVRSHYERDIRERLYRLLRPQAQSHGQPRAQYPGKRVVGAPERGPPRFQGRRGLATPGGMRAGPGVAAGSSDSLRNSLMASGGAAAFPQREALLLRAILNHPWLIEERPEEIAALSLTSEPLLRLREALLSTLSGEKTLDNDELRSHLDERGFAGTLGAIEQLATHRRDRFAEVSSDRDTVEVGWLHAYALHERLSGLRRSLEAAERAWHADQSEEAFATVVELQQRLAAEIHTE